MEVNYSLKSSRHPQSNFNLLSVVVLAIEGDLSARSLRLRDLTAATQSALLSFVSKLSLNRLIAPRRLVSVEQAFKGVLYFSTENYYF